MNADAPVAGAAVLFTDGDRSTRTESPALTGTPLRKDRPKQPPMPSSAKPDQTARGTTTPEAPNQERRTHRHRLASRPATAVTHQAGPAATPASQLNVAIFPTDRTATDRTATGRTALSTSATVAVIAVIGAEGGGVTSRSFLRRRSCLMVIR